MSETAVHSFVVRFVQEDPRDDVWRGFIRHVQTSEETHFTQMQEAIQFMGRFVALSSEEDNRKQDLAD